MPLRRKSTKKQRNQWNLRRYTTSTKIDQLDSYYINDRALQVKEHILDLKKKSDPEKEMILQKIENNIKMALNQHFNKKVKRKKTNGFTGDLQSNQDIKMININENSREMGVGPSIDYQDINEDFDTAIHYQQDLQPNFDFNDFSILDDLTQENDDWCNEESKKIFDMIQKQIKIAKIKQAKPKKTTEQKRQQHKSQNNNDRVIKVIPYGIH